MRTHISLVAGIAVCAVMLVGLGPLTVAGQNSEAGRELGHAVLPANDGWAAFSTGTTGGAAAVPDHEFAVTDRQQLVAAVRGDVPKIVYVSGTIDGNVDDDNQPLSCERYAADGYSLDAYLKAYDPAVWGMTKRPDGPWEDARTASQKQQGARVQIPVGANTTIIGLGDAAYIHGANLLLRGVDNVIIRNLSFGNAHDCFPQWDPTDGNSGNWNSQYDNISLLGATHVWVDHCAFSDAEYPDSQEPVYFGRPYQVHDGELDITNGSDLVTVSWNRFADHDKTSLIGSTDTPKYDVGKLRVTLHHNYYEVAQRAPRVRYGQVHVYNNYYHIPDASDYQYSWGVGVASQIYAESNAFVVVDDAGVAPAQFIRAYSGTVIHEANTLVNGQIIDLRGAYNAVSDTKLTDDVGWMPALHMEIDPVADVPALVTQGAGPRHGDIAPQS